jgi:hypothetical protein
MIRIALETFGKIADGSWNVPRLGGLYGLFRMIRLRHCDNEAEKTAWAAWTSGRVGPPISGTGGGCPAKKT